MAGSVRIRLVARPGHLPGAVRAELDRLDARLFPADEPYPKDGCYWWLAEDAVGVVGFAGLKVLDGPDEGACFLSRAGVLERGSGAGIQRRLIRARVWYARRLGLRCALTYAARDNFVSIANLIRCGFHLYQPAEPWGGTRAMYFILDEARGW